MCNNNPSVLIFYFGCGVLSALMLYGADILTRRTLIERGHTPDKYDWKEVFMIIIINILFGMFSLSLIILYVSNELSERKNIADLR